MNFAQLPMTDKTKKIVVVSAAITLALAAIIVIYVLVRRLANKEIYLLKVFAEQDRQFWSNLKETNPKVSAKLVEYWKSTGINFTEPQMQNESVHSTYPWSAAYISNLVLRSGFKNFKGSTTHASYVVAAKKARASKLKPAYWAYKPSEKMQVDLGDILVANRGSNTNLDTITPSVPTHGDIVVGFEKKDGNRFAIVQGGNVSQTVKTKLVKLTDDFKLKTPYSHFAHLKYEK